MISKRLTEEKEDFEQRCVLKLNFIERTRCLKTSLRKIQLLHVKDHVTLRTRAKYTETEDFLGKRARNI